jgi:hypothetical protein
VLSPIRYFGSAFILRIYRHHHQSCLHLGMAVGTEQSALFRLDSRPRERTSVALVTQVEGLGRRIEMVKLERPLTAGVSTDDASATCLFDQLSLDDLPSLGRSFSSTSRASIVTAPLEHKVSMAVPSAFHPDFDRISGGTRPLAPDGVKSILAQPMTNRRRAPIQPFCDLTQRESLGDKRFQRLPSDLTFRRMQLRPARLKTMLLQPVADRRWVASNQFAYRVKRQVLGEAVFEEALLHPEIIGFTSDRKLRPSVTRRRARCGLCAERGRRVRG